MIAKSDSSCVRRVYRRGRETVIVFCVRYAEICMVYGIFQYTPMQIAIVDIMKPSLFERGLNTDLFSVSSVLKALVVIIIALISPALTRRVMLLCLCVL